MPLPYELLGGGGSSSGGGDTQGQRYSSGASSLLLGQLKKVQRYGTPDQVLKAQKIAKGGHKSLASNLLENVIARPLGLPVRTVEASIGWLGGIKTKHSFAHNIWDPGFGAGQLIESAYPTASPWAKRIGGFAGDVALDPLTYVMPESTALKELGAKGLSRLAYDAAEHSEGLGVKALQAGDDAARASHLSNADEWSKLGAKVEKKGAGSLSKDELNKLSVLYSGEEDKLNYGLGYRIPFGQGRLARALGVPAEAASGMITTARPFQQYGRTLSRIGVASRLLRDTSLGDRLSGNLVNLVRQAQSGDVVRARIARREIDAIQSGKGIHSRAEVELARKTNKLLRDSKKAIPDGAELDQALREAPTEVDGVVSAAGPTYQKLMANPQQGKVLKAWEDHLASLPAWAKERASVPTIDGAGTVGRDVIHDAKAAGRPYAPRVLSDEFMQMMRDEHGKTVRQGIGRRVDQPSWFQKKAHTVGDMVGDGEFQKELLRPGTVDPATGELAGSLEDQFRGVLKAQYGEKYVDPYERDFYNYIDHYHSGVANAVRNAHIQNRLEAHGITNGKYTWRFDDVGPKLTITQRLGKARSVMQQAEQGVFDSAKKLNDINAELDVARTQNLQGVQDVTGLQRQMDNLLRQKADAEAELARRQDELPKIRESVRPSIEAEAAARDQQDLSEAIFRAAKGNADDLHAQLAEAQQKVGEAGGQWDKLKQLAQQTENADQETLRLATAKDRVAGLYDDAAKGYATANHLEQIIHQGGTYDPTDPLLDMANHLADRFPGGANNMGEHLQNIANLLRSTADDKMAELHQYADWAPSTANPQVIRGELSGAVRRMKKAGQAMTALPEDSPEWLKARDAYAEAAVNAEHRRNYLSIMRSHDGSASSYASLDEAQKGAIQTAIASQDEMTAMAAGPREQTLALMDAQREQWVAGGGDPNAVLKNPGGGFSWHHGASMEPLRIRGDFPLDNAIQRATAHAFGEGWIDFLHAPALSSSKEFSLYWGGDISGLHDVLLHANPDRVKVFGPYMQSYADVQALAEEELGHPGSAVVEGGTAAEHQAIMDVVPPTGVQHTGNAGPGYSTYMADAAHRIADENPGLLDRIIGELRAYQPPPPKHMPDWIASGAGGAVGKANAVIDKLKAKGASELYEGVANMFDDAQNIQRYLRADGKHLNFDAALHVASVAEDYGMRENGKLILERLDDPGIYPMPDDFLTDIHHLTRVMFSFKPFSQDLGEEIARTMRQSYQRDFDVIMFTNMEKPGVPIFEALATSQNVLEERAAGGGQLGVGGFEGIQHAIGEARQSYTGKLVKRAGVDRLQAMVDAANPMVKDFHAQFTAHSWDLDVAVARRQEAQNMAYQAAAQRHAVEGQYQQRVADLGEAVKRLTERKGALDESTARLQTLEAERHTLMGQMRGHENDLAFASTEKKRTERMLQILGNAHEGFGYDMEAPSQVVEGMADMLKSHDPITGEGLQQFLGHFDHLTRYLKGWLVASPAFQLRNLFGGLFNNRLAGVDLIRSGHEWGDILFKEYTPTKLQQMAELGLTKPDSATWSQHLMHEFIMDTGVTRSGLYHSELGMAGTGNLLAGGSPNPMAGVLGGSKSFYMPQAVHRLGEQAVEPFLRGQLAWDRAAKAIERGRFAEAGIRSLDDITEKNWQPVLQAMRRSTLRDEVIDGVNKYHFDYDDLSEFERKVVRRAIPFYTWTRKNVPLQLEAMATQPGRAINNYMALKRNMELGTPQEGVTPSWFSEMQMMRLPWSTKGGRLYGTVDLPFKDPFKVLDVTGQLEGMLNPIIKAPLEVHSGKQFFNDVPITHNLVPMPKTWMPLIPLMKGLDKLPFVPIHAPVKDKSGNWMIRENDAYVLSQYLPFIQQTRRLLPSEPKYSNRLATSLGSYLGGVQVRTNTIQDQESEKFRRANELTSIVNDLHKTGRIPTKKRATRQSSSNDLMAQLARIGT